MAYKTYKPESLAIPGIQLPGWFNSVDPLTFQEAEGSKLSVDRVGLQNQMEQEKLDILAKKKEASERLAKESTDETLDPDAFLEKAKKIYLETGNYDDAAKVMDDQRQRAEDKRKAEKPTMYNTSDGIIALNPDGTSKVLYQTKDKGGRGEKADKLSVDFFDPTTGATTKVDITDPNAVARAGAAGFTQGKPKGWLEKMMEDNEKKSQEKALPRTIEQGPGIIEKLYNSITGKEQPKQIVVRRKRDVIPKAR